MSDFEELRDHFLKNPVIAKSYREQKETLEIGRCLGQLLQRARKQKELLQVDVAERSRIQQSEISRIESGGSARGPTFETLVRYAHSVGMQLAIELVDAQDNPEELRSDDVPNQALRVVF